jgi:hypothetical protein
MWLAGRPPFAAATNFPIHFCHNPERACDSSDANGDPDSNLKPVFGVPVESGCQIESVSGVLPPPVELESREPHVLDWMNRRYVVVNGWLPLSSSAITIGSLV